MVATLSIASLSAAPEASPASAPAHPATDWPSALILLVVVLAASVAMGILGWKKRDQ
ncbi:MAG: hypothetical protein U0235_05760 [Polyangiaceae bacterium]